MKDPIDTMAALRGGCAATVATALILLGIIFIIDKTDSRTTWGIFAIICGVVFLVSIRYFGRKGI
ncbi:hypothetical protein ACFLTQ_00965 [Chloroflexota bacterium]